MEGCKHEQQGIFMTQVGLLVPSGSTYIRERQSERETDRQTDRERETERDREWQRQTDRQKDKGRERTIYLLCPLANMYMAVFVNTALSLKCILG